MHIITDWRELKALAQSHQSKNAFYQSLFNYIFQAVEQPSEENYHNHWLSSKLLMIDSKQDRGLSSITNQQDFIHYFPQVYQAHITYLLQYPEFTESLTANDYISLAIVEDYGSGLFLTFDKVLAEQCQVLEHLIKESLI